LKSLVRGPWWIVVGFPLKRLRSPTAIIHSSPTTTHQKKKPHLQPQAPAPRHLFQDSPPDNAVTTKTEHNQRKCVCGNAARPFAKVRKSVNGRPCDVGFPVQLKQSRAKNTLLPQ
jgi:hypothetical protein